MSPIANSAFTFRHDPVWYNTKILINKNKIDMDALIRIGGVRLAAAVRKVDLDHLPNIDDFKLRNDRDRAVDL